MKDVKGQSPADPAGPLTSTLTFRLGTLGAIATERFTEAVQAHGLKPKQVGLMAVLAAGTADSQQDIARTMGVAPSLVVSLADHLETLGAIRRERDPNDRRRQVLTLTDRGHTLLAECTTAAHTLDAALTEALPPAARQALHQALTTLAAQAGLPT
ncbi:MarR family winged helix-turn-helix transcriptional regulator [Embleya sp. NPDC020886]|uniref:MarR family winged helix-turn-helix transcriptional regulator n=1 Tax=Embleya sp. NPDC020886 TaxID=3363980 RepID=UPI0037A5379E